MCLHLHLFYIHNACLILPFLYSLKNKPSLSFHQFLASVTCCQNPGLSAPLKSPQILQFYSRFLCLCSIIIYGKLNTTKYNNSPKSGGINKSFLGNRISHSILFSSKITFIKYDWYMQKARGKEGNAQERGWSITQWADLSADPVMYATRDVPSE